MKFKPSRIPKRWRELLLLLPGYSSIETAAPGDYFDSELAELALDFFPECLVHIKGPKAGKPLELDPWQRSIVANLFGWQREEGGRRYRETLIYVPRKLGTVRRQWSPGSSSSRSSSTRKSPRN